MSNNQNSKVQTKATKVAKVTKVANVEPNSDDDKLIKVLLEEEKKNKQIRDKEKTLEQKETDEREIEKEKEIQNKFENFSLDKIRLMSFTDAKIYLDKYFIPLTDNTHYFYLNGKYINMDVGSIKGSYFARMSDELNKYYFKEKTDLKTETYELGKPVFYDEYINLCPQMKQSYIKPFSDFSESEQSKALLMLNHIKVVLCSNNTECYEFLLKWLAKMIKGYRNDSLLYLRGPQGAGKSVVIEFLRDFVIGRPLSVQSGAGPLKQKFNGQLDGKVLVMFEELENSTKSEWEQIGNELKKIVTSETLMIELKNKNIIERKNINNYIVITNNNAIKDSDGRRIFCLDISSEFIGNRAYFDELLKCRSDNIGAAFFAYLYEIDFNPKKFNSQDFPETNAKNDAICAQLDNSYKFLKYDYLLRNIGIDKISVDDLHKKYILYCLQNKVGRNKTKMEFNQSMKVIGFDYKKIRDKNLYDIPLDALKIVAKRYKWVHHLDEYSDGSDIFDDALDNGVDSSETETKIDYEKLYQQQLLKIAYLENITKNKEVIEVKDIVKVSDEIDDDDIDYFTKFVKKSNASDKPLEKKTYKKK